MNYERKLNIITKLRWLSLAMGAIMFLGTFMSFGVFFAAMLSVNATVIFWLIVNRYYAQTILEFVKETVNKVIGSIKDLESIIEVNSVNSLIIARIYLINGSIQSALIKEAIMKKISDKLNSKHIKAVQIALINSRSEYKETKEAFNKQLVKELTNKSDGVK